MPETTVKPINRGNQNANLRLSLSLALLPSAVCLFFVSEAQWGFVHCLTTDREVSGLSQNRGGIIGGAPTVSGAVNHRADTSGAEITPSGFIYIMPNDVLLWLRDKQNSCLILHSLKTHTPVSFTDDHMPSIMKVGYAMWLLSTDVSPAASTAFRKVALENLCVVKSEREKVWNKNQRRQISLGVKGRAALLNTWRCLKHLKQHCGHYKWDILNP